MKAICYYRVSSAKQAEDDKTGIPRQREVCRAFAKANDMELAAEFTEVFTGTAFELRIELARLFVYLETNSSVEVVLFESSDRMARDLMVSEMVFKHLIDHGVKVIMADTGMDFASGDDPSRTLVRQMFGVVAQFNKAQLVMRLRIAREMIRARGDKCEGARKFGHSDGKERRCVARAMQLRAAGCELVKITDQLNLEGFLNSQGRKWSRSGVSRLLTDPTRLVGPPESSQPSQERC